MFEKNFICKYKDNLKLQQYILDNYNYTWVGIAPSNTVIDLCKYSYGRTIDDYDDIRILIDDKKMKYSVNDDTDDNLYGVEIIDFKTIIRKEKFKKLLK